MDGVTTTGVILLSLAGLVAADGVVEQRAGFMQAFWAAPVEDKLGTIARARRPWMAMGGLWVAMVAVASAGMTAFTMLLLDAGAGVWAGLALGAYLVTGTAWMLGAIGQTVTAALAAAERASSGITPAWLHPAWQSAWWTEVSWVVAGNVAAVSWGLAMLETGFPSRWAGWTAVVVGAAAAVWGAVTRNVFPQLALLVPIVVGVALVIA